MTDLQELYRAVDRLNDDELERMLDYIQDYIRQRRGNPSIRLVPTGRIAALRTAVEDFWDGMSQEEIDAIVEDMNAEYIEPLDDEWLSDEDNS